MDATSPLTAAALEGLVKVRARREELTQSALQAATEAVRVAQEKVERRRLAVEQLIAQIDEQIRRPFRDPAATTAMAELHLAQRRLELLRDRLRQARDLEREARADLQMKEGLRVEALRAFLRARIRHQTAAEQLQRINKARVGSRERRATEAAQEQAIRAAMPG
jgi:hypothetical protein